MNIYIVFADQHKAPSLILAVFSTKEQAKAYYKKHKKQVKQWFNTISIETFELNKENKLYY